MLTCSVSDLGVSESKVNSECDQRRDFGKSNNLNMFQFCLTCLLFNLFTVKITLFMKRKQTDVTLLNKFLL